MPKVKRRTGGRAGTRRLLSWSSLPSASLRTQHTVGGFSKQLMITPWEMQTLTPTLLTSASGRQCFLKMQRFHVQLTLECFLFSPAPQPAERFPSSHFTPLCDPEAPRAWRGVCRPLSCPRVQKCPLLKFLRTGPSSHSLLPPQAQLCSSPIFTESWLAGHP